jgi:hypothetical protein
VVQPEPAGCKPVPTFYSVASVNFSHSFQLPDSAVSVPWHFRSGRWGMRSEQTGLKGRHSHCDGWNINSSSHHSPHQKKAFACKAILPGELTVNSKIPWRQNETKKMDMKDLLSSMPVTDQGNCQHSNSSGRTKFNRLTCQSLRKKCLHNYSRHVLSHFNIKCDQSSITRVQKGIENQ